MKKGKEWLKEAVGELNLVDTVFEADGVSYMDTAVSVMQVYDLIELLDEPEKVVIPKLVANYIEWCQCENGDRQTYTEDNSELWFALNGDIQGMPNSVSDWLFNEEKVETFARAWLDGYKIEKEKLYQVIIPKKNVAWECYYLDRDGRIVVASNSKYVDSHTEEFIRSISDDLWQFAVEVAE